MNFYEILKTKKLGRGSPDYWTQLFAEHAGGKGEWKVAELTGTLPMTFRSNGTALVDYRIYGTADGAGVQTENLFDNQLEQGTMIATGEDSATNRIRYDTSVAVEVNTVYSQSATLIDDSKILEFIPFGFNGSIWISLLRGWQSLNTNFNTGDCKLVRIVYRFSDNTDISPSDVTNIMLVKGSTAPDHFIPHGYKLSLKLTSGTESKDTDIYIGDSKLGAEEYVDYEEQKVYKRTENLFNKDATDIANGYVDGEHLRSNGATSSNRLWAITEYIPIAGGYSYTFNYGSLSSSPAICYYDSSKQFIQGAPYGGQNPKTVSIPSNVSYIRFSFMKSYADAIMLVRASSLPETYIPYLQPTDPPLSLPEISTYNGTNTLDSTETLGEVTIKGQIKPQS